MSKKKPEKWEKELWDRADADQLEWERLSENPNLKAKIREIQFRYGFPLSYKHSLEWFDWLEPIEFDKEAGMLIIGPHRQRYNRLDQEIKDLAKQFDIPDRWHMSLFNLIVSNRNGPDSIRMGFPDIEYDKKTGKLLPKITSDTAVENPIVQDEIKLIKDMYRDPPPQPQKSKDNHGRLDWRPVYEWKLRHPGVTYAEIAKMLYRSHTYVRSKLAQFQNTHKK